MDKNIEVAKQLVNLANNLVASDEEDKMIISKSNDPSEFNNFKKHIMDVCKSEIKVFQELNYFCQMNFDASNQNIDVFDDIQAIKQMIQKMFNKAKNAKHIK